ncbi:conserved hypothetical protein [Leptospira interrogans serovar Manilae]|uniref:Uncharacterized protein n=1 Tax=Leptospira interrogans serovar Manilae TaxID=214675 RepID=A0AAQ1SQX1_LEPIR|nr:conserved hypothetical protein [Leptospira interrogans serovar Manilae]
MNLLLLRRMKIALKVDDQFYQRRRIFQKIIFKTDLLAF